MANNEPTQERLNDQTGSTSAATSCSPVTWDRRDAEWFIAWRNGKPVSAFRFESEEVHRRRSWCDQQRTPLGMWSAWVPDGESSRIITWPHDTPIDTMKRELIAADVRLH